MISTTENMDVLADYIKKLEAEIERLRAALDAAITLINDYRERTRSVPVHNEEAFERSLDPLRANGP